MGVEWYFVKRDDGGAIEFPCWRSDGDGDDDDDALPHHTYFCIASLKWAFGDDRMSAAGLMGDPLSPSELVVGATAGLRALLDEYLALAAEFRALPDADATDPDALIAVLQQFQMAWIGADSERVAALANESASVADLFTRALAAGRAGYSGYWSY